LKRRGLAVFLSGVALSLFPAGSARAGDIVAFLAEGRPSEVWGRGFGAALSFSFFRVVTFEGEAAQMTALGTDRGMTSFTGSALLSPPIGKLTPYAGLGVGLYRQTAGPDSQTSTLRAVIAGVKLQVGGLIVLKAEYRDFNLSSDPLLFLESRFSAGAGISF